MKVKKKYNKSVKKHQTGQFNLFMDKLSRGGIISVWREMKPLLKKRTQGQIPDLERFKQQWEVLFAQGDPSLLQQFTDSETERFPLKEHVQRLLQRMPN